MITDTGASLITSQESACARISDSSRRSQDMCKPTETKIPSADKDLVVNTGFQLPQLGRRHSSTRVCCVCATCSHLKCKVCRTARYCGSACQKTDWVKHRKICTPPPANICLSCHRPTELKCVCGRARYCSKKCQIADRPVHKKHCDPFRQKCFVCHVRCKPLYCLCDQVRYCSQTCQQKDARRHLPNCPVAVPQD